MRQVGLLAAGALHAMKHHRQRLVEDHANAKALAEGLSRIDGVQIECEPIQTNIVRFRLRGADAGRISTRLHDAGILLLPSGKDGFRAVTHLMISAADIGKTVEAFEGVSRDVRPAAVENSTTSY
jgi:threonine aldolase